RSVWHKEILWALSRGVRVYGAASMGALRAAELSVFGMVGVGEVFRAFASGELEDDDEVAVVHQAGGQQGYRATSEALDNIRATLASAAAEGVVRPADRDAIIAVAKGLFYPERSVDAAIAACRARGVALEALAPLQAWLGP